MASLRVMTFNVRGARFADGANIWPNRAELAAGVVRRSAPDLIGFQELDLVNYAFFRSRLPGYEHALGPGYNNRAPFQYPAIFWRSDRLRLAESGGFWLSTTPEVHSPAWDTDCIRSAAWVRLALRGDGRHVLHLNTHLDHISEQARAEGARLIAARLARVWDGAAATVVTGDFNCAPGSAAHRALTGAGLADAHTAVHGQTGPVMTFHGFQGPAYAATGDTLDRIDWVLVRGARPTACDVLEDAEPPLYPSDHYPVLADLAL